MGVTVQLNLVGLSKKIDQGKTISVTSGNLNVKDGATLVAVFASGSWSYATVDSAATQK